MERDIKFIDSSYRELFKIPDGGVVKITLSDGEVMERRCKYIDDYHFELLRPGNDHGEVYHICQFAEINERNGNKYEPIFSQAFMLEVPADEEQDFVYASPEHTDRGCIGRLRCDFGRDGSEFYNTWEDESRKYKTIDFLGEFDEVINHFRMRSDKPVLKNLTEMSKVCASEPSLKLENGWTDMYMFKVRTEKRTYFIRCIPKKGDYNAYVYCYNTERLEQYKDTRFVEKNYGEITKDKFFKTEKGYLETYYNPDAVCGGQIVFLEFDNDIIRDAAKFAKNKSDFFGFIESSGYEYFIDVGEAGFRDSLKDFVEKKAGFEGLSQHTMDSLKKEAGIKTREVER